jgi:hypothetical protein
MQADLLQPVIVELTAAATIQAEASGQRLLFEWGQYIIERLRGVWEQIENLDTLAIRRQGDRSGTDVGGGNFVSVASAPQSSGHSPAPQALSALLAAVSAK